MKNNLSIRKSLCVFLSLAAMTNVAAASVGTPQEENKLFTTFQNGVNFQTEQGRLRVEFVTADIVRVQYTEEPTFLGNGTIVCEPRTAGKVAFSMKRSPNDVSLQSDSLCVRIDLRTHAIEYRNATDGRLLLAERASSPRDCEKVYTENVIYDEASKRVVKTANGDMEVKDVLRRDTIGYTWKFRNHFEWADGEALYGLGCHMEDFLNLRGKEQYLCQHNLKAMVPVLNSTAGYGLLFDAGSGMQFKDKDGNSYIQIEAAKQIDYYFMKGHNMDKVVAQYRLLTGDTPMMPRYLFGYIQSKERYTNSQELIDIVSEYRKRQVPLDLIVQDWSYWPAGWGYMKMDRRFYPDPKALADSIHAKNAKLMISIWPNPTNCPQTDDFRNRGMLLENSVYDAFNPKARSLYWDYANNEFFSNGFDAWWCDCTEPVDADWGYLPAEYGWDSHKERWEKNEKMLGDVLGKERSAIFSLYHSRGIYENQRLTSDRKRVVNLTRSSYAGQQRYATITWNGDTHASWPSFAQQIPAGLNFMATGCAYWTLDIGAFFVRRGGQWFWRGDYNQGHNDLGYRELYTRMFQFGAFLPLFRSHGTDTPREIWRFGEPGEPFYDTLLKTIHLRYRLLPYIYSMAGAVHLNDYTMSRMLAFDFANDPEVLDVKDQFMFGSSLLVCPVTKPMYYERESKKLEGVEKTREVYLPKGAGWVDFWTGKRYDGGQRIVADAPIEKIPLFVRQGSIIPMGPVVQYAAEQKGKELELAVYPGKDAEFILYDDEGDNYDYEQGKYTTVRLTWNNKKRTLTIGERNGSFDTMDASRSIRVVLHDDKIKESKRTKTVDYTGKEIVCKF